MSDHECDSGYFDRTLCGCGAMHSYCDTCDRRDDPCSLDEDPPRFANEAARTTHAPLSQPHSPEAHIDPTGALGGSQGVEAIRARLQASLDRDLWHPALDDVRRVLAALDEARAERDSLLTVVASVRKLADEAEWVKPHPIHSARARVVCLAVRHARLASILDALTPTTTETGDES